MTEVTPGRTAELEASATTSAIVRDANAGLSNELARLPLLDEKQVGHLRHIRNLASLPDGDWSFMGIADPGQEATISYRYQLAKMAYALGLAHHSRLPAAPGAFRTDFQNLVRKMLRYDVWSYWEKTSQSNAKLDPGLQGLRTPWMDPVVKENIMYSGHVHAMAGMYAVLFDDARYEVPGGLTFAYEPLFAPGGEKFEYDFTKLNEVIYWQMVETGYVGVPCEPNTVFLVCNQFPILGFRFHDIRKGTELAGEVTRGHFEAWKRKGLLDEDGKFRGFWMVRQDTIIGSHVPWTATIMNAWNGDFVRSLYPQQVRKAFISSPAGTLLPAPTDGSSDRYHAVDSNFGLTAIWLSEMGDAERLEAVHAYADRFLDPTWYKGGLYYPRNDTIYDKEGNFTGIDPWTGNALIALSRLNVPDGFRKLYNSPWDAKHFAKPNLGSISPNGNVLRGSYSADGHAMVLTVQSDPSARSQDLELTLANIGDLGEWLLMRDGVAIARGDRRGQLTGDDWVKWEDGAVALTLAAAQPTNLLLSWN